MSAEPHPRRSYSYSPVHRALEIGAIAGLPVLIWAMVRRAAPSLSDLPEGSAAVVVAGAVFGGYLAADFISGVVHFLGDTYGREDTKWFGPSFIKPFRVHHTHPQEICEHDFIELNGNNCIVCFPVGLAALWSVPVDSPLGALLLLTIASMLVWVFMTNQFHKWAHEDAPPRVVSMLQRWNLVLSPQHHSVHHRAPYDRYFCITVGWLNPVLTRLHFFEGVRRTVAWLSLAQRSPRK